MRLLFHRPVSLILFTVFILPLCFSQNSGIQVGDGATTQTIREEFLAAYQRQDFFSSVSLPPISEVVAYGPGGFRQEFQDPGKTGVKSALIRPAVPDLTLGVNNAVRQVRHPIYAVYTQSSIGVSTAGYPNMDTKRFDVAVSNLINTFTGGYYQTFDKGFGIFIWDQPPVSGTTESRFNVIEPLFARWKSAGIDQIGPPVGAQITATSRFSTKANYQIFTNGAIYNLTSGAFAGKVIYVRRAVQDLYDANMGPAGFLGFPVGDETILADGRRRQSFEGGTMEYALNGVPVLKNALQVITVSAEDPIRLSAGQTISLNALLQTIAGEYVTDREVFWSTSNGRVVTVTGTGPRVTIRAVGGGSAVVTATSEGKTSNRVSIQVSSQCCSIGEGAPTQAISQSFTDAIQRNRIVVRTPVSTPVRRVGAGYAQEAIALPAGERFVIAKADSSPVAYVIASQILATYEGLGMFGGALGFPLSDVSAGLTQRFENGALAGSPVRIVSGPILSRWLLLGAETGALGPPVGAANATITFTGNSVTTQQFRNGFLHRFDSGALSSRAFVTSGLIAAKHVELGLSAGEIGAPLTDEFLSATGYRQEFEGAILEYSAGTSVRLINKARKPSLTITPSTLLPGSRYRVALGGFAQGSRLRLTQGSSTAADAFDVAAANGSYVWESVVPPSARAGIVLMRATDLSAPQSFAEGSYTVRLLAELRPTLAKLAGDLQSGAPSSLLAAPLKVLLKDSSGNPLSGVPLRFEASPGAAIVGASVVTDSDGIGEARLRLSSQAGVVLATVEAGGQFVTFSARAIEQLITDFPRVTQAVEGNVGNSSMLLSENGSLLAAMAGVIRFYQQRGVAPTENGIADTSILNSYLKNFCVTSADGGSVCDGFLDAGLGVAPVSNPFRVTDFANGSLSVAFPPSSLTSIREAFAASGPVVVALRMSRNGQVAGTHFVTVTGILADGDLAIADPNPQFGINRLSQYTRGFSLMAGNWIGTPVAAIQFATRTLDTAAFYGFSTSTFQIASQAAPCNSLVSWPATMAHLNSTAGATVANLQACDGSAATYQVTLPSAPFIFSLVSLTNPGSRSLVSGATEAAYRVGRSAGDFWSLSPEQLTLNSGSILNAANFSSQISAGSIVSVFGNGLPLANSPQGTVKLNDEVLPILFSNGFQLNTVIPTSAAVGATVLSVRSPFGEASLAVDLDEVSPGIFIVDPKGSAAALNQDSTLNSSLNPAARGQAIVLFMTGLGRVERQSNGLNTTLNPVLVIVNGREMAPFFAGLTPGFIGLYQVNVNIPLNFPPGLNQSVLVRTGDKASNRAYISIR